MMTIKDRHWWLLTALVWALGWIWAALGRWHFSQLADHVYPAFADPDTAADIAQRTDWPGALLIAALPLAIGALALLVRRSDR